MQTWTHIYKDLDTVIKHTNKWVSPKHVLGTYYSKISANSSSSNLFICSVSNVFNLLNID